MTIEEQLNELILSRYKSLREFTQVIDMPYSTMNSILQRGIGNSSVTNIIKICKALHISADELSNGRITPVSSLDTDTEYTDVSDIIESTKRRLSAYALTIDGKKVDKETIDSIIDAIDVGVEVAKRKNQRSTGGINDTRH